MSFNVMAILVRRSTRIGPMLFAAAWPVAAAAPPAVLRYPGLNNVYGRAQYKADSAVVRFLGTFNSTDACAAACIGYARDGDVCHSFTYHEPNFPSNWKRLCFGVVDHSWLPVADEKSHPPIISSGVVQRAQDACGGDGGGAGGGVGGGGTGGGGRGAIPGG